MSRANPARTAPSRVSLLCFLVAFNTALPCRAQCATWDGRFQTGTPDNDVHALLSFDDGGGSALFVGGAFHHIGTHAIRSLARWDGSTWSSVGSGVVGAVADLHVHDFGQGPRLVAGGNISQAGGAPTAGIAVWDGATWSALGGFDDGAVAALATYDDGSGAALYAAGTFTHSQGAPTRYVAKWNGSSWVEVGGGMSSAALALEVFDSGSGPRLYAGGEFVSAGTTVVNYIAAWDGSNWSALGLGLDGPVNCMKSYRPNMAAPTRLHVGGEFQHPVSLPGSLSSHLASWSGSAWTGGNVVTSNVYSFAIHDEGNGPVLFAGCLTNVLRCSNGTTWATSGNPPQPGVGAIFALASHTIGSTTRLYAGGARALGVNPSNTLSQWDGVRWLVTTDGQALFNASSLGTYVWALASPDFGSGPRVFAGGRFTQAGSVPVQNLAEWVGTGWSAMSQSPDDEVLALTTVTQPSGTELYVGGRFRFVGSQPANCIARWDGGQWSALGSGVSASGGAFVRAIASFTDVTGPAVVVGGRFDAAGGVPAANVARWAGGVWSALGPGVLSGTVNALAEYDDGSGPALYVGGSFTVSAPGLPVLQNLARWSASNGWSQVGADLNGEVRALQVFDDGSGARLFAGGSFTASGSSPLQRIASWNGSGWSALGAGLSGSCSSLGVHHDGAASALYVGGGFSTAGGVPTTWLARWRAGVWSAVTSGANAPNGTVLALHSADEGTGHGPSLFAGYAIIYEGAIVQLQGCRVSSFCTGDGLDPLVTTTCPCGNVGAPGRGCGWSSGPQGALLAAQGSIAPQDHLVLVGSSMPQSATAIYLKGDLAEDAGSVLGDGVRCVSGNLIRLGAKINVAGASQYPEPGNLPVSQRGQTPVGSGLVGYYQIYYRNAANFCTSGLTNTSNGLRIVW